MSTEQREGEDWWRTSIIEMTPGVIRYRGYPVEELIAQRVSLAQMLWLMTRGELPSKAQGALLEAALMAAVDHGPQAPSIAIARMAATCGVGLNSAMASAVNVLGDVHGGCEIEPLPAEHPLWQMPNVIITPHVAAASPHIAERHLETLLEKCFAPCFVLVSVADENPDGAIELHAAQPFTQP